MDAMHELVELLLVIWFSGERHGFPIARYLV